MPKPRITRTPITDIRKARNLRTGRMEIWSAASTDGTWTYERLEEPGTPWAVTHVPTGRETYYTSLPKARAATESGETLRLLDAWDAAEARRAQGETTQGSSPAIYVEPYRGRQY